MNAIELYGVQMVIIISGQFLDGFDCLEGVVLGGRAQELTTRENIEEGLAQAML